MLIPTHQTSLSEVQESGSKSRLTRRKDKPSQSGVYSESTVIVPVNHSTGETCLDFGLC